MTIALYVIAFSALTVSFFKSREKTLLALKKAWKSFENILPQFLSILIIIGMMLAILTPEQISKLLGSESGWYGVLIAAVIGSITIALNRSGVEQCNPEPLVPFQHGQRLLFQRCDKSADFLVFSHPLFFFRFECDVMFEYGGLELTAEAARFYTSGRARFTPPGGHILQ